MNEIKKEEDLLMFCVWKWRTMHVDIVIADEFVRGSGYRAPNLKVNRARPLWIERPRFYASTAGNTGISILKNVCDSYIKKSNENKPALLWRVNYFIYLQNVLLFIASIVLSGYACGKIRKL